ncbi:hypothetical protein HK405_011979, partial [Cladochytrium tenue]
ASPPSREPVESSRQGRLFLAVRAIQDEKSPLQEVRGLTFVPTPTAGPPDTKKGPLFPNHRILASTDLWEVMYDACRPKALGYEDAIRHIAIFEVGEKTVPRAGSGRGDKNMGTRSEPAGTKVVFEGSFVAQRVLIVDASKYLQRVMYRHCGNFSHEADYDWWWKRSCLCRAAVESFIFGQFEDLEVNVSKSLDMPSFASYFKDEEIAMALQEDAAAGKYTSAQELQACHKSITGAVIQPQSRERETGKKDSDHDDKDDDDNDDDDEEEEEEEDKDDVRQEGEEDTSEADDQIFQAPRMRQWAVPIASCLFRKAELTGAGGGGNGVGGGAGVPLMLDGRGLDAA